MTEAHEEHTDLMVMREHIPINPLVARLTVFLVVVIVGALTFSLWTVSQARTSAVDAGREANEKVLDLRRQLDCRANLDNENSAAVNDNARAQGDYLLKAVQGGDLTAERKKVEETGKVLEGLSMELSDPTETCTPPTK